MLKVTNDEFSQTGPLKGIGSQKIGLLELLTQERGGLVDNNGQKKKSCQNVKYFSRASRSYPPILAAKRTSLKLIPVMNSGHIYVNIGLHNDR